MTNKEAIILVRVSTINQDYEAQLIDLKKYAQIKGYSKVNIIESKESGLADFTQREGLNSLYNLIESNPNIDAVFATEMSRLSRKESILHDIKEYFIRKKIQFYLKDSDYCLLDENTRKPKHDGILFTLFGYFAESEATIKKDRFARAKKALLENGFSIGGPPLFGFEKIKEEGSRSRLIINEDQAKQVQTIFNWYLNGIDGVTKNPSVKRISKECIFQGFHKYTYSKRNVNKLLKEEGYLGVKITHNKRKNPEAKYKDGVNSYIISENKIRYPSQIIPKEIFEKVQEKLKSNISEADKTQHSTILARLIKCPKCGNHLSANYRTSNKLIRHTYRCTGRSKTIGCKSTLSLSMSLIDSAVWSVIKSDYQLLTTAVLENNPNKLLEEIDRKMRIVQEEADRHKRELEENESKMIIADSKGNQRLYEHLDKKGDRIRGEINYWQGKISSYNLERDTLLLSDDDKEMVLRNSISSIEQSKELLKKFVNLFVSNIRIIFHDQSYSGVEIHFKRISDVEKWSNIDGEIERQVYVLLDKRETLKIKGIKVTKAISINPSQEISWASKSNSKYQSASFESIYKALQTGGHGRMDLNDFKILNFNKLSVYQATKKLKSNEKDVEEGQK